MTSVVIWCYMNQVECMFLEMQMQLNGIMLHTKKNLKADIMNPLILH